MAALGTKSRPGWPGWPGSLGERWIGAKPIKEIGQRPSAVFMGPLTGSFRLDDFKVNEWMTLYCSIVW